MSDETPEVQPATLADLDAFARRLMAVMQTLQQFKQLLFPRVAELEDRLAAVEKHLGIEAPEEPSDEQAPQE